MHAFDFILIKTNNRKTVAKYKIVINNVLQYYTILKHKCKTKKKQKVNFIVSPKYNDVIKLYPHENKLKFMNLTTLLFV